MLTDLDRKLYRKLHGDCHGLHCGNLRTSGPKWPAPVPEAWWGTVRLTRCLLEALQFGGYRFRFSNISVLEIHSRRVVLRNAGYMYRVIVGTAYSDRYPYPTKATHHNLWGRWIPHGHNPLWSLLGKAAAVYAISICGLFPHLSVRCSYGLWIRAMKYHIARFVVRTPYNRTRWCSRPSRYAIPRIRVFFSFKTYLVHVDVVTDHERLQP